MLRIAERGYSYEHEMAFFPGLPYLLRLLGGWHGSEAVYLLLGTLISCISFILATHALYQITLKSTGSESWASKSAGMYHQCSNSTQYYTQFIQLEYFSLFPTPNRYSHYSHSSAHFIHLYNFSHSSVEER